MDLRAQARRLWNHPRTPAASRIVATLLFAMVWHPVTQCLWLNLITPVFTSTELEAVLDHHAETGEWKLPARSDVDIDSLPERVPQAFLSAEDQRFWEHAGFDLEALQKAWDHNQAGGKLRGGSTISQQVSRNVFLWQGRSYLRKGLEAWYTVFLELFVPKRRILELYINVAETGPLTFGVEAGAHRWYGKDAKDLSAREAAAIASLLPAPSAWKPDDKRVRRKVEWILLHPAPTYAQSFGDSKQ